MAPGLEIQNIQVSVSDTYGVPGLNKEVRHTLALHLSVFIM